MSIHLNFCEKTVNAIPTCVVRFCHEFGVFKGLKPRKIHSKYYSHFAMQIERRCRRKRYGGVRSRSCIPVRRALVFKIIVELHSWIA